MTRGLATQVLVRLDPTVLARIDAVKLRLRGGARRGRSEHAQREEDVEALMLRGLEAMEAEEAARDTDRTPPTSGAPPTSGTPATPRNDVPVWLRPEGSSPPGSAARPASRAPSKGPTSSGPRRGRGRGRGRA